MKDDLISDDMRFEENIKDQEQSINTLHESVWTTLSRDFIRIKNKLFVVIIPFTSKEKEKELRHWDLWGPFLFCILFGL